SLPTNPGNPGTPPSPQCTDFTGQYKGLFNNEAFAFDQDRCGTLTATGSWKYINPNYPASTIYSMEQIAQNIDGLMIISWYEGDTFKMSYRLSSGDDILEIWSFATSACQSFSSVANLEMRKFVNGKEKEDLCKYWQKL
ncbi:MAG: hypothetical protein AAF203_11100, partial [Pseudomonadota bacterium]